MTDVKPPTTFGPSAILTPANIVTVIRLAAAPLAFSLMHTDPDQSSWLLVALWFALSTSDMIDGNLARRYGTTRSGAFLDPLADKFLTMGGIAVMCMVGRFPWLAFGIIAVREAAVSVFRSVYVRRGLAVPASRLAKWKAFVQMASVGWVTLPWTQGMHWLSLGTLWVGVAVGVISGAQYFVAGGRAATNMAR